MHPKLFYMRDAPFTPEGGYGKTINLACAGALTSLREAIEEIELHDDPEAAVETLLVVRDYLVALRDFDEVEDVDEEDE